MPSSIFENSLDGEGMSTPGSARFLTPTESSAWLASRGLVEKPAAGAPGTNFFQFAPRPTFVSLRELFTALLAVSEPFDGGLLLFDSWHWEGGCASDPTASYRRGRGDSRSLHQVPGFVVGANEAMEAAELLAMTVERRWGATFYSASKRVTFVLRDGNQVDVFATHLGVERCIQHRLVELGAVLFIP
ncbi:hypothetical protein [Luteibacter sp.]|jgi:hypothetical protein|uniref:hypothetical protein n=1 Tax=Luteibacter sp. TaxID=1886636 RepID=UPI002F429B3C